ncbi:MAG: NPCBM/NEW2 domain-containing protein [Planctomycetota bacterium]
MGGEMDMLNFIGVVCDRLGREDRFNSRRGHLMVCLATLTMLSTPLFAGPSEMKVTVQRLSGDQQTGRLVTLDDERAVVKVNGVEQSIDTRELRALIVGDGEESSQPESNAYVELVDGTRLVGDQFTVKEGTAEVRLGDRKISIETRDIGSVRFHAPSEALAEQWREIAEGETQADVIVLRRSETAIDQLEGIFHDVTEEAVEFEYDGDVIPVKRTKLEGMVYHHPPGRELPVAACAVEEIGSTVWQARSLEVREGRLHVSTPAGVTRELPWSQVARLNFSSSNMTYLSDLEFELVECTPFVGSRLSEERIKQLYGPHRDASFEGEALWLADGDQLQRYEKGLAIHSRTELVYRLTQPYRKLMATAGVDSRLEGRGNLVLVIEGDGHELFRRPISGQDPPISLDLDIEGVRRLRILVDYGESLDIADHLNLCNARIIK